MRSPDWHPTHTLTEPTADGEHRTELALARGATPGVYYLFTESEWNGVDAPIPALSVSDDGIVRRDGREVDGALLDAIGGPETPAGTPLTAAAVESDQVTVLIARAMLLVMPPPAEWGLRNGAMVDVNIDSNGVGILLLVAMQIVAASQDIDVEDLVHVVRAGYGQTRGADPTTLVQAAAKMAIQIGLAENPDVVAKIATQTDILH
jgi:hypothetical protein